jgi:diguanylate cyclase (GGDEF)-like protein
MVIGEDRRLGAYRRLARPPLPRGYAAKALLLAFVAAHLPLLALVGWLLATAGLDLAAARAVLLVALAATLAAAGLALAGLWVLLAPVAAASRALRAAYRGGPRPALPLDIGDEGGVFLADVERTLARLEAEAGRDGLTGALTRRAGEERLRAELAAAARGAGPPPAVAVLDADGLKAVNDRRGHAAGDGCLRHLAAVLERHVGGRGWVARWGGDEFVAVVREGGGLPPAEAVLGQAAAELAAAPGSSGGEALGVGVSWGVARPVDGEAPEAVLARADAALYAAKRAKAGRGGGGR